jgi:hypothetical protein
MHQLSLIAPAYELGAVGGRYRKAVLFSTEDPIRGFSAVHAGNGLYILVAGSGLSVVRVGLS